MMFWRGQSVGVHQASPQLTLVSRVHGSIRFASKVLREFGRVGDAADDPEPGRAVRVRDDALVGAFWCPDRAPNLSQKTRTSTDGFIQDQPSPSPLRAELKDLRAYSHLTHTSVLGVCWMTPWWVWRVQSQTREDNKPVQSPQKTAGGCSSPAPAAGPPRRSFQPS